MGCLWVQRASQGKGDTLYSPSVKWLSRASSSPRTPWFPPRAPSSGWFSGSLGRVTASLCGRQDSHAGETYPFGGYDP